MLAVAMRTNAGTVMDL